MKKTLLHLIMAIPLLISSLYANTSFEKYAGCYKTIQVNGQPTIDDSGYQQTQIYMGNAFVFADIDRKPIPAVKMFLFKGYSKAENKIESDFANIFLDRGILSTDSDGDHFAHKGPLWFWLLPAIILNGDLRVDAKSIENKLVLHVYMNVPELGREVDDTYVLEQEECS